MVRAVFVRVLHGARSTRTVRVLHDARSMLVGGSMQRAARAMHCIALSQIQCPQWECCGPLNAYSVEIGPQWELSGYLLRIPGYRNQAG